MSTTVLETYDCFVFDGRVAVDKNLEQGNYELSGTLTNQATGESITLNFVMDLNSELEVDTYNKVITWLEDDSRQFQAISFSSQRRHWLRLEPGNNTLEFVDVGTGNVTLTTVQTPRYY